MAENNNIIAEKIRIAMVKNNDMKLARLSEITTFSAPTLTNKFKKNNFNESDLRQIATALGYDVEISLISKETGERI